MNARFCIDPATIGFDVTLEQYIAAVGAGGFRAAEWPAAAVPADAPMAHATRLGDVFRAHGVEPKQFTSGFGVPGNLAVAEPVFEGRLSGFDRVCAYASCVGTTHAALFFDMERHEGVPLTPEAVIHRIERVAAVAHRHGVQLAIGWHDASLLAIAGWIYTRVGEAANLLIDTFTLHRAGLDADLIDGLPDGAISWVRVGDARPGTDGTLGPRPRLLPGRGAIDILGMIDACVRNGYSGPLSIEARDPCMEGLAPAERARAAYCAMTEYFG